ncbi:10586_t:CDS:10, partial [Cetraspora pellucida]
ASFNDKDRKNTIKDQTDELETLIQWYGLEDTQIVELLEVILKGKLDDSDVRKLIKFLVPRKKVSEISVIKIFGNLGNKNMKHSIQALLLRWVVLVYGFIRDHSKLYRLYGVIFHYLEYATLRMELQARTGYEPHIQGLLKLYKDYFPNLVTINIQPSRSITFKCPDMAWSQLVNQIQRRWNSDKSSFNMPLARPTIPRTMEKRRKIEHNDIPTARTYNVTQKSVTIDEMSDIRQLASNIDKVELPNQLASILDNRMLQHVIVSNPERVAMARISYWIDQYLMDLVYWSDQNTNTKMRLDCLLNKLVTMTEFMKELLPDVQEFLTKYVYSWDGGEYQELIFRLLTFLRTGPYNQFYEKVLKPLQFLYCDSSASWKSKLIRCYTDLLKYWTLLYGSYYERMKQGNSDDDVEDLDDSIEKLSINGNYPQTILDFIDYVDRTILIVPEDENQIEVQHAILSFMEISTFLQLKYKFHSIVLPSYSIIYRSFFSTYGMPLSRICGIILRYQDEFDKYERDAFVTGDTLQYNINQINYFNSFAMDLYNGIWRNRPFNKFDKNAKGFQLN